MRPLGALRSLLAIFAAPRSLLYAVFAAAVTLGSLHRFLHALFQQTGNEWSAPLDDVYIHFDYARSIAEGHPFEWFPGNGYSSGNTSILYPFVLALGYLFGERDETLIRFALVVAALSVFGSLLALRRVVLSLAKTRGLSPAFAPIALVLLPLLSLGIGGVAWSLWSGMEGALFALLYAVTLAGYADVEAPPGRRIRSLGLFCLLLVLTRPEAVTTVLVFGIAVALESGLTLRQRSARLFVVGAPSVLWLFVQATMNFLLTGSTTPAGAIAKLRALNPTWTLDEKIADYLFNLKYILFRVIERHMADHPLAGLAFFTLALAPLFLAETARVARVIFAQAIAWVFFVALNHQVRWQNERYVMPALSMMLLLGAIGTAAIMTSRSRLRAAPYAALFTLLFGAFIAPQVLAIERAYFKLAHDERLPYSVFALANPLPPSLVREWMLVLVSSAVIAWALSRRYLRVPLAALLLVVGFAHQSAIMREQAWFFGRAAKNIRDQHFTSARILKELAPRRVLLGDAGSLVFFSRRPAVDLIGLGGTKGLPFASAWVQGLGPTLELVERLGEERPDVMVIYPSWWGMLSNWFSGGLLAKVPAEGNVICGGYEDVLLRTDWSPLDYGHPESSRQEVLDEVDVADLVSEREHRYVYQPPLISLEREEPTVATLRMDAHGRGRFDGGRRISPGQGVSFRLVRPTTKMSTSGAPLPIHLTLRVGQETATRISVTVNGQALGVRDLLAEPSWQEIAFVMPAFDGSVQVDIRNEGPGEFVDYHAWLLR